MSRRELTENEKKASKRLTKAFKEAQAKDPSLTQVELGGRIGMTQSGVGHYLNGRVPLNLDALFSLSSALKTNPAHIFPEMVSSKVFGDSDMLAEFLSAYTALDPEVRGNFLDLMKAQTRDRQPPSSD